MPIQYQQMIFFISHFAFFKSLQRIGFWISKAQLKRRALSWHEERRASP